jgi:hypothetical protein
MAEQNLSPILGEELKALGEANRKRREAEELWKEAQDKVAYWQNIEYKRWEEAERFKREWLALHQKLKEYTE